MEYPETNKGRFSFLNCPSDVLRLIFEAAVTRDEQGFKTAMFLSHVSRHWRTVALSTPALWSYVSFSAFQSLEATMQLLQGTCERIGNREVFLVVKDLFWEEIQSLQNLKLERITNMKSLKLQIAGVPSANALSFSESLGLSGVNLTKFDLTFDRDSHTIGPHVCGIPFLFPNLQHLHIGTTFGLFINFKANQVTIKQLTLLRVGFTLPNLIQRLPSHEVLELEGCVSMVYTTRKLEFLHLKKLKIYQKPSIGCLSILLCPALEELWCDEPDELDDILIFLKKNHSITSLKINARSRAQELADVAPQLQHLTTRGLPTIFYSPSLDKKPLFPHLRTLTIDDSEFESFKDFDTLIRSRCLPVAHQQSELLEGCSPLEVLGVVMLDTQRVEDTVLVENELVKEAKLWIDEDETWGVRKKVCMSWRSSRTDERDMTMSYYDRIFSN